MRRPPPAGELPTFPVTGGLALLAIAVTALAWREPAGVERLVMSREAFRGEPWRLVTGILPHADVFHIAFNVYWLWVFGTEVEQRFGALRMALLVVLLAVISSAAEYALFAGGVGLSGVGYGLFGLAWVRARRDPRSADLVDRSTVVLFLIWFVLCVVLTAAGTWRVGNTAHGAGLVAGALVGFALTPRGPRRALGAALLGALLGASLLGASVLRHVVNLEGGGYDQRMDAYDLARAGGEASARGDSATAIRLYRVSLALADEEPTTWHNLGVALFQADQRDAARDAFRRSCALGNAEACPYAK